jgi:hypothetical protein
MWKQAIITHNIHFIFLKRKFNYFSVAQKMQMSISPVLILVLPSSNRIPGAVVLPSGLVPPGAAIPGPADSFGLSSLGGDG